MTIFRKRKVWAYRFWHNGEDYSKSGFATAAEAERAEATQRRLLSDTNTFTALVKRRLEYVQAYCTKQHYLDSKTMLRRFAARWGHLPVSMITKSMIQDWILDMVQKMFTNNNINRHIRALKTLFQLAVDGEIIHRNPVVGIKFLPHEERPKTIPSIASINEMINEMLMRASAEERAYLTVIWMTGARVNEINQLAWEDVDFDKGTVSLSTRKSKGGVKRYRTIPMLPQVKKALQFMWSRKGEGSGTWVFENPRTKKPYIYRDKLILRVGQGKIGYHHLRHTTATILAALGVETPTIQKILGHSRLETTERYIQSLPSSVVEAMEKLGEHYG